MEEGDLAAKDDVAGHVAPPRESGIDCVMLKATPPPPPHPPAPPPSPPSPPLPLAPPPPPLPPRPPQPPPPDLAATLLADGVALGAVLAFCLAIFGGLMFCMVRRRSPRLQRRTQAAADRLWQLAETVSLWALALGLLVGNFVVF